jgi:uncharacterized membrane protein YvbJ
MSILKRADLSGKTVISSTLLKCPNCGHKDIGEPKKCPKCGCEMDVQQSSKETDETDEQINSTVI